MRAAPVVPAWRAMSMRRSKCAGVCIEDADRLRVVQVKTVHVKRHVVAAERAGDAPPAAFAQQRQPLTHQAPATMSSATSMPFGAIARIC